MNLRGHSTHRLFIGALFLALSLHLSAAASDDAWQSSMEAGNRAYQQGHYAEAQRQFTVALNAAEAFGRHGQRLATSLNNLAALYKAQGKYASAEPLYRRALTIGENTLGPEHPDVAINLDNLALLYQAQGNYAAAEPLHHRALAIREQAFGPQHPNVAQSFNNLAELYRTEGKYAEAEPLYQRALAIREKALGVQHPSVATSLNNLAELYRTQGDYAEAEPLYQRALAIRERMLGSEHPDVATSLNNLALLDQAQGKYAEAKALYRRSLAIKEKSLGPRHPSVATSLSNLALLYQAQGNYVAAEPLYKRALSIQEKALGPQHPNTATTLNNLATAYKAQGKYAEAEPLYRRALAILEKTLGPQHPSVATSLSNLALLYEAQGKYAAAEPLFKRSLAIREQALGPEHPEVAASLQSYADLLRKMDRAAEAQAMEARAMAIRDKPARLRHERAERRKLIGQRRTCSAVGISDARNASIATAPADQYRAGDTQRIRNDLTTPIRDGRDAAAARFRATSSSFAPSEAHGTAGMAAWGNSPPECPRATTAPRTRRLHVRRSHSHRERSVVVASRSKLDPDIKLKRMQRSDTSRRHFLHTWGALPAALLLSAWAGRDGAWAEELPPTPACTDGSERTPRQMEGPFFKLRSPQRTSLLEPGIAGTKIVVAGLVLSTHCRPVAGALLDFWQADDKGAYDNDGFKLRGHQVTDRAGHYRLETIVPGLYPGRTRHIHVKVQAPNRPVITTQLYFRGEARNERDFLFDPRLLIASAAAGNGQAARFDFVVDLA